MPHVLQLCRRLVVVGGSFVALAAAPALAGASEPRRCPAPQLPPGTTVGAADIRYTDECLPYVRTPSARFARVAGYRWAAHYARVDGLRMHYVDVGPRDGQVVLMLHGEPSWSYLYRKMIPVIARAGYRAIAVDMVGMGKSDKPVQFKDYSYLHHVRWVEQFMKRLALREITLFAQDWGGLIGLRVVGDRPRRFARVVAANTLLPVVPTGFAPITVPDPPTPDPALRLDKLTGCAPRGSLSCFARWAAFALTGTRFRASDVVERSTVTRLTRAERAAYDAPFPARIYLSGARVFPSLINTLGGPPDNTAARAVFDRWTKPLLTLFGRRDPTGLGSDATQALLRDTVPGARGRAHHAYQGASHFIQEDKGADLARRLVAFIRHNRLPRRR